MSTGFDDDVIGKAYDSHLMRRLLTYARPYWRGILLSIILLMVITVADLSRPYLIKIAIDNHISALSKPMVAFTAGSEPRNAKGITFENMVLVRESSLKASYPNPRYQVLHYRNAYYLAQGVTEGSDYRIVPAGNAFRVESGKRELPAQKLTSAELESFRGPDILAVERLGLIYLAIIVISFLLNYAQAYLLQWAGQKIIYDIRQHVFTHLQKMSLAFFDHNPVGRLVTRVTNDTEALNEMYTAVLINLFKDLFLIIGIVVVMIRLNLHLSLIGFTTIPLIIIATALYQRIARAAYREVRTWVAQSNVAFQENISGIRVIQAFNREEHQYGQFREVNRELYKANMKELISFALFRPSMDLIYSFGVALLIWFGGGKVVQGVVEFGVLYALINYTEQFFHPINDLSEKYNILQSAMASSERIFHLLDTEPAIRESEQPHPLTEVKGEIRFDHVWFAYNPDQWVLRDVSFTVQPGQTVAIVGPTGAGKTSIINLLSRFYDIQQGTIYLDGVDIRELKKEDLRRSVGLVLQDVFLFAGDIGGNIRLNNTAISEERLEEVARYVNAHGFISRLPGGYAEEVQERGSTLSAGERQLLAFARTLAFEPPILVLDEATANIDTETEALIQDALGKLTTGRTTLVIAHRLSTIQRADKIIVLHRGRIREEGTHQELLAQRGLYYRLYQLQNKASGSM
ncbi:MAG: ABC transporter ATP-binding protein [Bacillota bacterium]